MVTSVDCAIHMGGELPPRLPRQLLEVLTRGVETGATVLKGLVNLWQAKTSQYLQGDHAMQIGDHARVEYPLWAGANTIPPGMVPPWPDPYTGGRSAAFR